MIRGFLNRTSTGQWILSPEPHLKSCCIGSSQKKAFQIVLDGKLEKVVHHQAYSVRGILQKNRQESSFHYTLQQVQIIDPPFHGFSKWILGFLFLLLLGIALFFVKNRKIHEKLS